MVSLQYRSYGTVSGVPPFVVTVRGSVWLNVSTRAGDAFEKCTNGPVNGSHGNYLPKNSMAVSTGGGLYCSCYEFKCMESSCKRGW